MNLFHLSMIALIAILTPACQSEQIEDDIIPIEIEEIEIEIPDWTEATHSNDVDPNYEMVFPDDQVIRLDITISAANWTAMQSDLDVNLGSTQGGGGMSDLSFTPIWIPCSLVFNGIEWYKVGIRYKGNSTLRNAYRSNTDKFPFKLDFDEFEDNYPAIKNQRFYGFKQLNLSNGYSDASFMREKVAADLFREFGVPAARTSFCAVYLDKGDGANFIGMYTLVEEVDDSVPESQFEDTEANLYKPEGDAATFASGTYNTSEMYLKTNEDIADYADVKALYDVLHSSTRASNESQWTSDLEAILDMDRYLKYLAANTIIQNWDTYGRMTHNYFLYNNNGKLVWIPWDNNESMQTGKMGGALSLSLSEAGDDWPLIRYIMDVDDYEAQYKVHVRAFADQVYEPSKMASLYATYESLISSYASQENSGFSTAVSSLVSHASSRQAAVDAYLE